jgi:hypothetical protein
MRGVPESVEDDLIRRHAAVIREIVPFDGEDPAEVGPVIAPAWTTLCCDVIFGQTIRHQWSEQRCKRCDKMFAAWLFGDLSACLDLMYAQVITLQANSHRVEYGSSLSPSTETPNASSRI